MVQQKNVDVMTVLINDDIRYVEMKKEGETLGMMCTKQNV